MKKPPASTALKKERGVVIEERFEVITPIFGGGVHLDQKNAHEKEPDELTPVRASSVRGQLRFWWRATQAHRFETIGKLREAEAKLWGAASEPAKVSLAVDGAPKLSEMPVFRWVKSEKSGKLNLYPVKGCDGLAYGAFSLRPDTKKPPGTDPGVITKVVGALTVRISTPSLYEAEVREAVDAWLLFGGIGGRTRRGFGAVAPVGRVMDPQQVVSVFKDRPALAGLSSLAEARLRVAPVDFKDPIEALDRALDKLRRFRQGPGCGRNEGDGPHHPGRSRWPEADTIRVVTEGWSKKHPPEAKVSGFPRAAFGLPIIFHFKDVNHRDPKNSDPGDSELRPKDKERRSSPLIIRPVRTASGFRPIALVMNDPSRTEERLVLAGKFKKSPYSAAASLTSGEAVHIKPLQGEPDPLAAFLNFFSKPA